jgi:cation transport regulator
VVCITAEGGFLPYVSVEDLPPPIRAHLPQHAQEIYLSAFNNAWTEYAARGPTQRERTAHRVAWAAVKRKYQKAGDRWIPRDD